MDETLEEFHKFYTSFGSILDISLINPEYQYVIVKPIRFLRSLDSFLCPNEEIHKNFPTICYGIIPETAFKSVFQGDWPAFTEALVCLNLATRVVAPFIEMPSDYQYDRQSTHYFVSLSRTGPLVTDAEFDSVHVITSINTQHVFKQVSITKQILGLLPNSKLVPCKNLNKTIIKNEGTTITLVSHSPVMRISLDKPDEVTSSNIVKAYSEIDKSCKFPVEYKFVVFCVDNDTHDMKMESFPSSNYHILPDDELCLKCKTAGRTDNKLLEAWNNALRKENTCINFEQAKGDFTCM